MGLYQGRRIVTGHDSEGRSIVISDAPPENVVPNPSDPDRTGWEPHFRAAHRR